jgi:N-acetyl-anhydromuramyl-L-alanine amidase AmpD
MTTQAVVLPDLKQRSSPNQSSRRGTAIDLLVWHETAGAYAGSVSWLCNPASQASAHLVVREDGLEATQLVPLHAKAWAQAAYNPRAVGVEHANVTAKGYATDRQLQVSARIFGWLCLELGIPPRWARGGVGHGVCYHGELGAAGGGHTACGPDRTGWLRFLDLLHHEIERGGYKSDWAKA